MDDIYSELKSNGFSLFSDEDIGGKIKGFFSSGNILLDHILGGGYGRGRIVNIYSNPSLGKSLLCVEAVKALQKLDKEYIAIIDDPETSLDPTRAESLGVDINRVLYTRSNSVEEFFNHIQAIIGTIKEHKIKGGIYVLDSLDALSTNAELERKITDGTYGSDKARKLSEIFRRIARDISDCELTLLIVSQVRENIAATFMTNKETISGGKALQFYCSQRLSLKLKQKIKESTTDADINGLEIIAEVTKNKLANPFQKAEININFLKGLDNELTYFNFLIEHKKFRQAGGWYYIEDKNYRKNEILTNLGVDKLGEMVKECLK